VDAEVAIIVRGAHASAREILERERGRMDAVVERLLEVETLKADELEAVLTGVPEAELDEPVAG
jgi:ATP-dependent Zn protease